MISTDKASQKNSIAVALSMYLSLVCDKVCGAYIVLGYNWKLITKFYYRGGEDSSNLIFFYHTYILRFFLFL